MALTREQKSQQITEVSHIIVDHSVIVIADYTSVGANDMNVLRNELAAVGQSFRVVKKTLINLALTQNNIEPLSDEDLQGQVGLVYGDGEETAGARILKQFAKKHKLEILRSAVMEGKTLHMREVTALADLPSKEQLLGQVVGTIAAPLSGFVRTLLEIPSGLVRVLNARAQS